MNINWQTDIEKWVSKNQKIPYSLGDDLICFFELAFENTQHPDKAWFGVHEKSVSLVIGGILLAGINLSSIDYGIWLILDQDPTIISKVEYKAVKSTQKHLPLIWAHLTDVTDISVLLDNYELWHSYSEASNKILEAPISSSRSKEFQLSRHKQLLSKIWDNEFNSGYELNTFSDELQKIEIENLFSVETIEDARQKVIASIIHRQGQPKFRRKLLAAYDSRCCITGCDVKPAIEAAHIIPYQGTQTNHLTNGLPLRADIHTLFDLYLLSVEPETYEVMIAPKLTKTCYQELVGKKLISPRDELALPNKDALRKHYERFLQQHKLIE